MAGYELHLTAAPGGPGSFLVSRLGLSQALPDIDAVERFADGAVQQPVALAEPDMTSLTVEVRHG